MRKLDKKGEQWIEKNAQSYDLARENRADDKSFDERRIRAFKQ